MNYRELYHEWMSNEAFDKETRDELAKLTDEKEIEDRFYTELSFGTAGMRGVLGAGTNRMNLYNVRRATKGVAQWLNETPAFAKRGVVIAYDSRRYSELFAKQTALTFCSCNIKAYLFDSLRPVPILSYAVRHLNAAAGIVITASHNPPQYNGYKVYGEDGAQIGADVANNVTEKIRALNYSDCAPMNEKEALEKGLLQIIGNDEVDNDYMKELHTLVVNPEILEKEGKTLNIVYTPIHGSGNVPVRRILKEIGITNVSVVSEQEEPDCNFSTVKVPNPEDPNAFTLAIKLANEVGADVAFATDPDCDRLGVAVRKNDGKFILLNGNQIASIMLYYILTSKKKQHTLANNCAVVKSIVSTELARKIAEDFGVKMFETLTGFKYIGEKIQQFEDNKSYEFLFGFEESYGYLSSKFVRDKDGVNASMLIAEAAVAFKAEGKTLYDAICEIYNKYGWYTDRVASTVLPGKDGVAKMQSIMEKLRANTPKEIGGLRVTAFRDYKTGVRQDFVSNINEQMGLPESNVLYYELENGNWVCVRPSGTEPKIKLYVNANAVNDKEANILVDKITDAAKSLLK